MLTPGKVIYEFGRYRLDSAQLLLFRGTQLIPLAPKAAETLAVLVQNHGQLVEKEELMKAVWPDTFVEEANLTVHISALRKLFQDQENPSGFIETVPRRGYRFVAPVLERLATGGDPSHGNSAVTSVAASASPRLLIPRLAIAGLCVLALLAAVFVFKKGQLFSAVPRGIHSVAVLPLQNLSGDASQEYLADGLTEALVTDLAQVRSLRVISRTSIMTYKGTKKKLPEIARELNVDAVVEGSVMRSGDHVQVTAQLIEAPADTHLWAETYEGSQRDLLVLQNRMAQAIVQQVRVALTPEEKLRLATIHLVSPESHEAYLQGRYFWNRRTPAALLSSLELYEKATKADPNSAEAYAAMATVYATMVATDQFPPQEMEGKAKAAALKAMALDETLAEPHAALGYMKAVGDYDWDGSFAELERAIELDPSYALAHHWYGYMLECRGRFDDALREVHKAQELDPLNLAEQESPAQVLYWSRKYDECVTQSRKTLELDPNFFYAHMFMGDCLAQLKKYDEAIAEFEQTLRITPRNTAVMARLGYVLGMVGRKREALDLLKQMEQTRQSEYTSAGLQAWIYAGIGDREHTLESLEKDEDHRGTTTLFLRDDAKLDLVRTEPRFIALLKKTHLDNN
ncbi:MAG TPA: tetratricopeptide repeat protein [Candidatus Angelobacter sp.]|nr:tetratricopeptide repeat protein [Candidatus Angelobacter sp.]